jgi:hypothetical protein
MFLSKVKVVATTLLAILVLGTSAGIVSHHSFAAPATPAALVSDDRPIAEAKQPAAEKEQKVSEEKKDTKLDKVPTELYGFSGEVVGKLISKDAEKGDLVLEVRQVTRVWKPNKAPQPRSAEGKTLKIDGVFGKFLDVLVTLKEGDGVMIEVKHVKGDNLTFLGELLKKVELPPSKGGDKK